MSQENLNGKTIAFLATNGFEQVELTEPWEKIKQAGATVKLISLEKGKNSGDEPLRKGGPVRRR